MLDTLIKQLSPLSRYVTRICFPANTRPFNFKYSLCEYSVYLFSYFFRVGQIFLKIEHHHRLFERQLRYHDNFQYILSHPELPTDLVDSVISHVRERWSKLLLHTRYTTNVH